MKAILNHFQLVPHLQISVKAVEEIVLLSVGPHPYYQSHRPWQHFPRIIRDIFKGILAAPPRNTVANPKGELKAITTRSGLILDGPTVHMPPPFINPEEDERIEKTLTDPEHGEYTIKVPPYPLSQ
ncbi:hypothetical protein Tco_0760187 [Tanacetum coccineum]